MCKNSGVWYFFIFFWFFKFIYCKSSHNESPFVSYFLCILIQICLLNYTLYVIHNTLYQYLKNKVTKIITIVMIHFENIA